MAVNLIGALIHKFDTAANWTSNDPTLLENEFGWESDTGKVKRGDGSTSWTGLSYFNIYASGASDGLGLKWSFSTATSGTPSPGKLEFDTGTIASVGSINFHDTGSVDAYGREFYQGIQAGDGIFVQEVGDPTKYVYGAVTAASNTSSITTVEISLVGYGSLPTNGNEVSVIVAYAGQANVRTDIDDQFSSLTDIGTPASDDLLLIEDTSASGAKKKIAISDLISGSSGDAVTGMTFLFDATSTSAGASSGDIRFNNATPGSVTAIYVSDTGDGGADYGQVLGDEFFGTSHLYIEQVGDNSKFLLAKFSGKTDGSTYWAFTGATVIDSGTIPDDNAQLKVTYIPYTPAPGATTFPGLSDTPGNYTASANKLVAVNSTPDGLEFIDKDGVDGTAIHDNVAGEINAVTAKGTPLGSDIVLIEDASDSYNKKKVLLSNMIGTDSTAIHTDEASEISGLTEKTELISSDLFLIEDSNAGNVKKKFQFGSMPFAQNEIDFTVGEAVDSDEWCYLKQADGKMWLTDASAEATASGLVAICVTAGTTSANGTATFRLFGKRTAGTKTAGATYYLSETPGAITTTAPTTSGAIVRVVGVGTASDTMTIDVSPDYIELS